MTICQPGPARRTNGAMTPKPTTHTNLILTAEGCEDLPATRLPDRIVTHWKPTPEEIELLNAGGSVQLEILGRTHPPVALNIVEDMSLPEGVAVEAEEPSLIIIPGR